MGHSLLCSEREERYSNIEHCVLHFCYYLKCIIHVQLRYTCIYYTSNVWYTCIHSIILLAGPDCQLEAGNSHGSSLHFRVAFMSDYSAIIILSGFASYTLRNWDPLASTCNKSDRCLKKIWPESPTPVLSPHPPLLPSPLF